MINRKKFIKTTLLGGFFPLAGKVLPNRLQTGNGEPVVISTWRNREANKAAWEILSEGGRALDAVESGARIPEGDPDNHSVGLGGYPDQTGKVTLDACIMDENGHCGSVAFMEHIVHPVSVARNVMEKTEHVMLVGEGALKFALDQGYEKQDLLTKEAREYWESRTERQESDNHDTIGILALDADGNLSGACTTSGTSMKMRGRVGDSPIIGSGLYVDNEVGGAAATGRGEEVIRTAGSHAVVEMMRQGYSPTEACKAVVQRIVNWNKDNDRNFQVGFIALNKGGIVGGYSVREGFSYAVHNAGGARVLEGKSLM